MLSPNFSSASKWYLSLEEYPYHLLPPYVTAGAYVLSQPALKDFYYGSFYVKRFKFDDVFLGLVSNAADFSHTFSEEFYYTFSEDFLTLFPRIFRTLFPRIFRTLFPRIFRTLFPRIF
jgi:hypothetical protein